MAVNTEPLTGKPVDRSQIFEGLVRGGDYEDVVSRKGLLSRIKEFFFFSPEINMGKFGKYKSYKLRTMKLDAAKDEKRVLAENGSDASGKAHNDQRVTFLGRFLRYGFDELPQLWNIFVEGNMDLVGGRPLHGQYREQLTLENITGFLEGLPSELRGKVLQGQSCEAKSKEYHDWRLGYQPLNGEVRRKDGLFGIHYSRDLQPKEMAGINLDGVFGKVIPEIMYMNQARERGETVAKRSVFVDILRQFAKGQFKNK